MFGHILLFITLILIEFKIEKEMKYFISKVVNILENFDLFSAPVMLRFKA